MSEPQSLRRDLGPLASYAALIGILVGAGIFKVTAVAYAMTGPSVVLGYVVLAPVILAIAIPYAAFQSTRLALGPGGDYAHIRAVFGAGTLAFLAAWLKLVSYLGALVYLALALTDYLVEATELTGVTGLDGIVTRRLIATTGLIAFWWIHCAGVRWFGRVQVAMCLVLGLAIVVLVGPGLFAIEKANFTPFFRGGAGGFFGSLPSLFFAYAGFEALAHTAGEVRDSRRSLPRVFLRGVLLTTVIFVAMSAVVVGVLTVAEVDASTAPMADAAAKFLPVGAAVVVALGGIMATATSVNATMAVPARLAIEVAGDRSLPRRLASIHPRTGTPVFGLTLSLLIALALLWSGQKGLALNIAVLALMAVYWLHSLAFVRLPDRNPELAGEMSSGLSGRAPRVAAWAALIALGILIVMLVAADIEGMNAPFLRRLRDGSLTSIELFVPWVLLGWLLHVAARARSPR